MSEIDVLFPETHWALCGSQAFPAPALLIPECTARGTRSQCHPLAELWSAQGPVWTAQPLNLACTPLLCLHGIALYLLTCFGFCAFSKNTNRRVKHQTIFRDALNKSETNKTQGQTLLINNIMWPHPMSCTLRYLIFHYCLTQPALVRHPSSLSLQHNILICV